MGGVYYKVIFNLHVPYPILTVKHSISKKWKLYHEAFILFRVVMAYAVIC